MNILGIGDPHASPDSDNDRFIWAGKLALDQRVDTIICMGDFADMPSLCSYDKGKKDFIGRSYAADVAATRDALEKFNSPIDAYNTDRAKNKKAQYKPRKIMLGGNHDEARINRAIQLQPELEGTISLDHLGYEEFGWEYIPYGVPIEVAGVYWAHGFPSGVKGEFISGYNIGASLLAKHFVSTAVGHNHLFDYAVRSLPDGRKIHGISLGCYTEENPKYAGHSSKLWWRGLCKFNNVINGDYDLEVYSIERVKQLYGGGGN